MSNAPAPHIPNNNATTSTIHEDPDLLYAVLAFLFIGAVAMATMIATALYALNPFSALMIIAAVAAYAIGYKTDHDMVRTLAYPLFLTAILLLFI